MPQERQQQHQKRGASCEIKSMIFRQRPKLDWDGLYVKCVIVQHSLRCEMRRSRPYTSTLDKEVCDPDASSNSSSCQSIMRWHSQTSTKMISCVHRWTNLLARRQTPIPSNMMSSLSTLPWLLSACFVLPYGQHFSSCFLDKQQSLFVGPAANGVRSQRLVRRGFK